MSAAAPVSAPARLADAVGRALRQPAEGVVRVEVPAPGVDPAAWLAAQPAGARRFWRDREGSEAAAASGAADVIDAPGLAALAAALGPRLAALPPGAAWYGAARFDPSGAVAPEWAPFGRVRFVLPRFELRAAGGTARLACHLTPEDRARPARVEAALARLAGVAAAASGDGMPGPAELTLATARAPGGRVDTPDAGAWGAAVARALDAVRSGVLEKVVLARRSAWALPHAPDAAALLARLGREAPGCFLALVEAGDGAFVSVTPERLLRLRAGRIETEAVAGTRPRADGSEAALLASEKDRREHALVVDDVRTRLAPFVDGVEAGAAPQVLGLRRRMHLQTRLGGTLRAGAGALDVLAALHPTPAVGGAPREAARTFIAAAEGYDRGLYAGPVGRVGRDADGREAADFAVGIRSALLRAGAAALFAGAGLVPGSDARAEWAEVEGKMSDLALALGLG